MEWSAVELDMTEKEPASVGLLDERISRPSNLHLCNSCHPLFGLAFFPSHADFIWTFELKGFPDGQTTPTPCFSLCRTSSTVKIDNRWEGSIHVFSSWKRPLYFAEPKTSGCLDAPGLLWMPLSTRFSCQVKAELQTIV